MYETPIRIIYLTQQYKNKPVGGDLRGDSCQGLGLLKIFLQLDIYSNNGL